MSSTKVQPMEEQEEPPTTADNNNSDGGNNWFGTKCPVCKQDWPEIEPKLLPCLHSVCQACLTANTNSVHSCPECQQEYNANDVIDNQFVKELSSSIEVPKDENKSPTCTNCDDNATATSFCTDCSEWLCDACVQAHLRVRVTKDHVVQRKEEAMGDQNNVAPAKTLFCPIHKQEQLKLFCETCDRLTCRDCQLREHRDHQYQFVSEASQLHKTVLQSLVGRLQEKKSHLDTARTLVNKRYKDLTEREHVVTNDIKMFAIRFITEINRRGKQLLQELREVCTQKKTCLGNKNAEISDMIGKLDHCLSFVESAVGRGSDAALLFSKRAVVSQLMNTLQARCEVPNPNYQPDIRFVYENVFLSQYIGQLGCLMVDSTPYQVNRPLLPGQMMPLPGSSTVSVPNVTVAPQPPPPAEQAPPYNGNNPQQIQDMSNGCEELRALVRRFPLETMDQNHKNSSLR